MVEPSLMVMDEARKACQLLSERFGNHAASTISPNHDACCGGTVAVDLVRKVHGIDEMEATKSSVPWFRQVSQSKRPCLMMEEVWPCQDSSRVGQTPSQCLPMAALQTITKAPSAFFDVVRLQLTAGCCNNPFVVCSFDMPMSFRVSVRASLNVEQLVAVSCSSMEMSFTTTRSGRSCKLTLCFFSGELWWRKRRNVRLWSIILH